MKIVKITAAIALLFTTLTITGCGPDTSTSVIESTEEPTVDDSSYEDAMKEAEAEQMEQ